MSRPKPDVSALQRRIDALEAELSTCQRLANELRESDERLRILTEATGETVVILERGLIVEVNRQGVEMFACPFAEAIGRPASDFVAPECRDEVIARIRSGQEEPYEAIAQRLDGTTFLAQFRGKSVIYRGRPARVTVILDLSGRSLLAAHPPGDGVDTPLLPLGPGAVLLALPTRALPADHARALARLPARVAPARTLVVDVTAVPLDAAFADALVAATRELAGVRTIVTGVADGRPHPPALAALELRPTLHDALRELSSAPKDS
jgi:PAS domain S-box-containing protein